jgi:ferredoxin-type protein NapG
MNDQYTRRAFFTCLADALCQRIEHAAKRFSDKPAREEEAEPSFIRPPGAGDESRFLAACTRCTDCIEACPYDSIRRLGPELGDVAGTPAIIPNESPCYLCADMPCITACPTDALLPLDRAQVRMAEATINRADCYQAMGQPCDYCVKHCPLGSDAIACGDDGVPAIDPQGCAGCGVCAFLCPADAVTIRPLPETAIA